MATSLTNNNLKVNDGYITKIASDIHVLPMIYRDYSYSFNFKSVRYGKKDFVVSGNVGDIVTGYAYAKGSQNAGYTLTISSNGGTWMYYYASESTNDDITLSAKTTFMSPMFFDSTMFGGVRTGAISISASVGGDLYYKKLYVIIALRIA